MGDAEVDLFRDTPVRLLGYTNEVGEAFRTLVHVNWVRLSYGVASAYVLADTYDKTRKANKKQYKTEAERRTTVASTAMDSLIWQTLASVAIPGFTINRICAFSSIALKKTNLPPMTRKWITTAIGLTCIPIIYKPIDNLVHYLMDNTVRKYIPQTPSTKD